MSFHGPTVLHLTFFHFIESIVPKAMYSTVRQSGNSQLLHQHSPKNCCAAHMKISRFFSKKIKGASDVPGKLFHTHGFTNKMLRNGLSCNSLGYDFLFKSNLGHCLHVTILDVQSRLVLYAIR